MCFNPQLLILLVAGSHDFGSMLTHLSEPIDHLMAVPVFSSKQMFYLRSVSILSELKPQYPRSLL